MWKFLFFIFVATGHVSALQTYYMDDANCGSYIDFSASSLDAIRLKLTASSSYRKGMTCGLNIRTSYDARFMLYFRSMSIESSGSSCSSDYLEVLDGSASSQSYVSGLYGRQCGFSTDRTVYTTGSNNLYLRFVSDQSFQYSGFEMIITSYHTGFCYSYEYSCSNGRCIDDSLTCNGYNPCGDHSDCEIAGGTIAGIVVGAVAFSGIVIVLVVVILIRRRRTRFIRSADNFITTSSTSYGTGYNQSVSYPAQPAYPGTQSYQTGKQACPNATR